MEFETLTAKLTGQFPLIMHNAQLADPMNKFTREIKKITNKGSKNITDADMLEKSRLEFLGGLYVNEDGPILTADMIAAAIIEGAKKDRKGPKAKAGIAVDKHAPLVYDGPRDPGALFEEDRHRMVKLMVPPGQGRIVRTRPIFPEWEATVEIKYAPNIFGKEDVMQALRRCGEECGIGDSRPRYGRFLVSFDVSATNGGKTEAAPRKRRSA